MRNNLTPYFELAELAIQHATNSQVPMETLAQLRALQSAIESEYSALEILASTNPSLAAARNTHSIKAKFKRATQQFILRWRGGGSDEVIVGWPSLANRLNFKESTLRVKFSRSGGRQFDLVKQNPHTDIEDLVYVIKLEPSEYTEIAEQ